MDEQAVILESDRGARLAAAIPAAVFIAVLAVIALWLSIAFGPVGLVLVAILIAAGVVVFFRRTTSVELSVSDDAVIVRNVLRTTRVPRDEVDGMALTPDGELQVLAGKRSVVVEAADGRAEADLAIAAERTMAAVEGREPDEHVLASAFATELDPEDGPPSEPDTGYAFIESGDGYTGDVYTGDGGAK